MKDILTAAIVRLYEDERFYAEILIAMDRFVHTNIPTAGVCIKDKVQLHVNPEWFSKLSLKEQVATLKHECGHIIYDHIPRFKEMDPSVYSKDTSLEDAIINKMKHTSMNVAADLAVNSNLRNLPAEGMFAKNFNLPEGEVFEWYFHNLKDNEKMKDINKFDDHSIWAESEGDKDTLKEKVRKMINEAAKRARAAGRLTSDEELLVSKLNYVSRDWKSDLRRFVARNMETRIESSRKKRNRRYGVSMPGIVKEENLHIGVAIDTSGSISDEALCQFMAEIANIAKYAVVTVVEADSEVKNSYLFDPKKQYKVKGRGGTAYQPALEYFTKETEVDGVIYLGDMDCYDNEVIIKPKYPVLWAIIGNKNPPVSWGMKTKIEVKGKN